jgi:hypothetical protein
MLVEILPLVQICSQPFRIYSALCKHGIFCPAFDRNFQGPKKNAGSDFYYMQPFRDGCAAAAAAAARAGGMPCGKLLCRGGTGITDYSWEFLLDPVIPVVDHSIHHS